MTGELDAVAAVLAESICPCVGDGDGQHNPALDQECAWTLDLCRTLIASDWLAAREAAAVAAALAPVVDALTVPLNVAEGRSLDYLAGMDAAFARVYAALPPARADREHGEATTCWRSECRNGCYYPDSCSERGEATT